MRCSSLVQLGLLAVSTLAAAPALAQDAGSGFSVSGGVTLVSDYRFRGISLSDEDPAIQGTIKVEHESGFYAGTWASSLEDSPLYGHTEVDLFFGYATDIADGTALDVGITLYAYPNGQDGVGDSDYFEPYVSLTHSFGPVDAKVGAAYAWAQGATGDDDNLYLFTDLSAPIPSTPVTLTGHLGYSNGSLAPTGKYLDWSLGLSFAAGPATIGLAYVDTDLGPAPGVDAGIVLSVGLSF